MLKIKVQSPYKVDSFKLYMSNDQFDINNLPENSIEIYYNDLVDDYYYLVDNTNARYIMISAIKNNKESYGNITHIDYEYSMLDINGINADVLFLSEDSIIHNNEYIGKVLNRKTNTYHINQFDPTRKPKMVDNVIKFNGSSHYLDINLPDLYKNVSYGWLMATFRKETTTIGEASVIGWSAGSAGKFRISIIAGSHTGNKIYTGGRRLDTDDYASAVSPDDIILNHYYIVFGIIDYANNNIKYYQDGKLIAEKTDAWSASATVTSNTSSGVSRIGSNLVANTPTTYFNGSILCAMAGTTTLTDENRQKIEGWVAHKYGLTDNLPADHPYKESIVKGYTDFILQNSTRVERDSLNLDFIGN